MKKKNIIAKELRTSKYRTKIVKPKKGRGSFKRKKNNQ
jgi:alternative ribosome-rescue factor